MITNSVLGMGVAIYRLVRREEMLRTAQIVSHLSL